MPDLTREQAEILLRQFTCLEPQPPAETNPATADPAQVRQAVHLVADQSDYQILGICADHFDQAIAALQQYRAALNYPNTKLPDPPDPDHPGQPVYVKFNPLTGNCHSDRYKGEHRGVLLSCQSSHAGEVNETFGHLPLDLFAGIAVT